MTHETSRRSGYEALKKLGGFVYLATPYSNYNGGGGRGREMAYCAACQLANELDAEELKVYAPIAQMHLVAVKIGHDALTHADWIEVDKPFMRRASALLVAMMPGWERSRGIAIEMGMFLLAGKPIFSLDVDTREIRAIGPQIGFVDNPCVRSKDDGAEVSS